MKQNEFECKFINRGECYVHYIGYCEYGNNMCELCMFFMKFTTINGLIYVLKQVFWSFSYFTLYFLNKFNERERILYGTENMELN